MVQSKHRRLGTPLMIVWCVVTIAGCADKQATAPQPVSSAQATATIEPTPANTDSPTAPPSAETTTAANVKASCAPWAPSPQSLKTHTSAGRADFFREYLYDFASGVVSVHDSDPFANGKEEKDPRVTRAEKTLPAADKARIDKALVAICPDEAALKAACAPGGCTRLTVKRADGESKVEHNKTVGAVTQLFAPFFPQLRH